MHVRCSTCDGNILSAWPEVCLICCPEEFRIFTDSLMLIVFVPTVKDELIIADVLCSQGFDGM